MNFFLDINIYRKLCRNANIDTVKDYSFRILDEYFNEDRKSLLSIDEGFIIDTVDTVNSENLDITAFDSAYEETLRIISEEYCPSFVISTHFAKAKSLMLWFNQFEELTPEFQKSIKQKVMYEEVYHKPRSIMDKYFPSHQDNQEKSVFSHIEDLSSQFLTLNENKLVSKRVKPRASILMMKSLQRDSKVKIIV